MRDDRPSPRDPAKNGNDALERELRALFAPVAAPRTFRRRLKSDLLRDQRSHIALPPDTQAAPNLRPLRRITTRRGMAILVSGAVAVAAAVLVTAAVRGFNAFTVHDVAPTYVTPTPSATRRPVPTRAVVVAPTPTATPSPTTAPTTRPASTQASRSSGQHTRHRPPPATSRPQSVMPTKRRAGVPTAAVTPAIRNAATATPLPAVTTATPIPPTPSATATVPPAPPSTPTGTPGMLARTATAPITPTPPQPPATATQSAPVRILSIVPSRTPAPLLATPTPFLREARPTATPTYAPRVTLPHLGVTVPLPPPPASATAPRPTATPTARATEVRPPPPTATPPPSATLTPTPSPSATPTATPSPSATPPRSPAIPLDQPGPAVPNAGNGLLGSPLNGAAGYAQQPLSYTVATTLTLAVSPTLAVYPLTPTDPTLVDALTTAHRLGATSIQSGPNLQPDRSIITTLRIGVIPYTLTVFEGYGTPWFTLHALSLPVGRGSASRVAAWATAWLHTHGLAYPDLRLLEVNGGTASFGQVLGGMPLLGSPAIQLDFDGQGALQDLSYAYVRPAVSISWALQPPALAAAAAIDQGQGLYQGPGAGTVAGPAAINAIALAYAGVHGGEDYLEPVYVLAGTVPTASGPQPFSLYAPALQYVVPTPTPPS